jgi:DNA polymerase III subunit delta'
MQTVFGHDRTVKLLEQQLQTGHLAHAYLFVGPKGVGKKTLAESFAKKLLDTDALQHHPDFSFLTAPLPIENVRELQAKVSRTPLIAKYCVAIIDVADQLSDHSANALLKTLEEPPPSTLLILLAETMQLLPTVVSRCQTLRLQRFSLEQLRNYAEQAKLPGINAQLLAASGGSIGRLRELSLQTDAVQALSAHLKRLASIEQATEAQRIATVTALAEESPESLEEFFTTWLWLLRERLATSPMSVTLTRTVMNARAELCHTTNKKLLLQRLLITSWS